MLRTADHGVPTGYVPPPSVNPADAEWFIAAIRSGLVEPTRKGDLSLPASPYVTVLFLVGLKSIDPRPISFAMEGFLSAATAARLHMLCGWPRRALGFESKDGAFDLIGMLSGRAHEYLAGEAKSTSANVAALIQGVRSCGERGPHDSCLSGASTAKNAHRKWAGLVCSKAPVFFVFGPAREWHVLRVDYEPDGRLSLTEADESDLRAVLVGMLRGAIPAAPECLTERRRPAEAGRRRSCVQVSVRRRSAPSPAPTGTGGRGPG